MRSFSEQSYYQTSDLALCNTLVSLNYQIEFIERNGDQRKVFYIKRDGNLDKIIEQYWTRQLRIEPIAYCNNLKNIKARIYND